MEKLMYSVVVPVFNGGRTIEELADRLRRMFEGIGASFEIVFVDDNSSDDSWIKIEGLAKNDARITSIKLSSNFGQHNATICGISYCRGLYVITMDDDLQHAPEDIPLMITCMNQSGAHVVIAKLLHKKHQWYRRLASHMIRKLSEITIDKPRGIHLSSFRLIDRWVIEGMLSIDTARPYVPALIFQITNNVVNAEVVHCRRKCGNSNYTVYKMLKLAGQLLANNASFSQLIGSSGTPYIVEKVKQGVKM